MSDTFSVKHCFCFFNTVFLCIGIAFIVLGSVSYTTYKDISQFTGSPVAKVAVALIIVGILVTALSFIGFGGSLCNNATILCAYMLLLFAIIILQIFTGSAFYIFRKEVSVSTMNSKFSTTAKFVIAEYRPEDRRVIDAIQIRFSCCGAKNSEDWRKSPGWGKRNTVPASCCRVRRANCGDSAANLFEKGCVSVLKVFIVKNLVWIGAVCIVLAIAEIFGMALAWWLRSEIKRGKYENMD